MRKSIRIKPEEPRETQVLRVGGRDVTFVKGKFYETEDAVVIAKCEATRTHFGNPKSPLLFDVFTPEEALAVHKAETEKREPSATPADPVMIAIPAPTSQAEFDKLPAFVKEAMEKVEATHREATDLLEQARAEREEAQRLLEQATASAAPPAGADAAPLAPPDDAKPADEPKGKGGKKG